MKPQYNPKLSNQFSQISYNQFQKDRGYDYAEGFSKEEIEWALYEIDYKYFGSYEFTDQQYMAVDILEWVAKEYLK